MDKKLEELTTKELQAELVKLGMPESDTKTFTTKASLIATINTLNAAKVVKKVDTLDERPDPKEERREEVAWQSKADRQARYFEGLPKVRILIPLEGKERPGVVREVVERGIKQFVHVSGAVWAKSINGYMYVVPKGVYVDVPACPLEKDPKHGKDCKCGIADNISNEYHQTQHAGDRWSLDRIDPQTGRPVRDQL